jgi:hypothetical protein
LRINAKIKKEKMQLNKNNFPLYLTKSDLYLSLIDENEDFVINVNKDNFKEDDKVENMKDLIQILKTCDYFGLDISLVKNIENFIMKGNKKDIIEILLEIANYGNVRQLLKELNESLFSLSIELLPFSDLEVVAEAPVQISINIHKEDKLISKLTFDLGKMSEISTFHNLNFDEEINKCLHTELFPRLYYKYTLLKYDLQTLSFVSLQSIRSIEEIINNYSFIELCGIININVNKWNKQEIISSIEIFNQKYNLFYEEKLKAIKAEYERYNS